MLFWISEMLHLNAYVAFLTQETFFFDVFWLEKLSTFWFWKESKLL